MTDSTRYLADEDYVRLADLRYALRRFLTWSADLAKEAGLTPAQHQLLLAIRASEEPSGPSVGDVAEILMIRHHSATGLVDRAQDAGLIERERDPEQHSIVRLHLTEHGAATLESLSELHLRELSQLAPSISALWATIGDSELAPTSRGR